MAQNTSLEGLRSQLITSIFGRRLALAPGNATENTNDYLVGPKAFRETVAGISSAGSTIQSTAGSTAISPYGVEIVGATGASGSSGTLVDPVPGVRKLFFNYTTGSFVIHAANASFLTTAAASTAITMLTQGTYVELIGLTTALWGVVQRHSFTTGGSTAVAFS